MDVNFRPATQDDIPTLSRLHLLAADGLLDAVYHDAIPGLPPNKVYEQVLARAGTVRSYEHASVAVKESRVIGEVHAYPFDDEAQDPPNPFIPKDRFVLYGPFMHLHSHAAGTYHIPAAGASCRRYRLSPTTVALIAELAGLGDGVGTEAAGVSRCASPLLWHRSTYCRPPNASQPGSTANARA
jgi:hypothetical protein